MATACEPECFDSNDCLARRGAGQNAACVRGVCQFTPTTVTRVDSGADAGEPEGDADAGPSSAADAGVGAPDAGRVDAGASDAGVFDAGAPADAGRPDAGGPVDAGGAPPALRDGGVFVVTLYVDELGGLLPDGGGERGRGLVSFVGDGGPTWSMRYRFDHDGGATVAKVSLLNTIAPLFGPGLVDPVSASGASPVAGVVDVGAAVLREVQEGRATAWLPNADDAGPHLRGQLVQAGEQISAGPLLPVAGFDHPGSGGVQLLLKTVGLTVRYEAVWSGDVVATGAHVHHPNGSVLLNLALLPDAGGARGVASAIPLGACQTVDCFTDVHTADAGAAGGVLLRTP